MLHSYSCQQEQHVGVVAKLLAQQADHLGAALLYAVDGDAKEPGNFGAVQSLLETEVEQLAVLLRQLADGSMKPVERLLLDDGCRELFLVMLLELGKIVLMASYLS